MVKQRLRIYKEDVIIKMNNYYVIMFSRNLKRWRRVVDKQYTLLLIKYGLMEILSADTFVGSSYFTKVRQYKTHLKCTGKPLQ